jgi:hypothetical protein
MLALWLCLGHIQPYWLLSKTRTAAQQRQQQPMLLLQA